jgi:hypothetical protein
MSIQCTSLSRGAVRTPELRRPLKDVRKAVYYALRGQVKRKSENNRTYYSDYHRPGKDLKLTAYKQNKRALLALTILGDRRPYVVSATSRIESLQGGEYKLTGYDKGLAKMYIQRVEDYLASRPEERDIIDDFRPY